MGEHSENLRGFWRKYDADAYRVAEDLFDAALDEARREALEDAARHVSGLASQALRPAPRACTDQDRAIGKALRDASGSIRQLAPRNHKGK